MIILRTSFPKVHVERTVIQLLFVGIICPTTGYTFRPGTVAPISAAAVTEESNLRKFLFLQITIITIIPTKMISSAGIDLPSLTT
jgi:hypothetical protein